MKFNKIISLCLACVMLVSSTSLAFADNYSINEKSNKPSAENTAIAIDSVIGSSNIANNIQAKGSIFSAYSNTFDVTVPQKGNDNIKINGIDTITMGLPTQVNNTNGILTDNGTMVYESDNNMSVAVQILKDSSLGDMFTGVRTLLSLENKAAPKEYTFSFDLPKGYSLIQDYDYEDLDDNDDCGAVYIVDNTNEIISVIDPAWAKDANGDDVETFYIINKNCLIQVINFNDASVFPIIADPTNHPNIPHYKYYTHNEILKLRDECTKSTIPEFVDLLMKLANKIPFVGTYISGTYKSIKVGETTDRIVKYLVWNNINKNFSKTYAKVNFPERWHSGHRCYYPATIAIFVGYTNTKPKK